MFLGVSVCPRVDLKKKTLSNGLMAFFIIGYSFVVWGPFLEVSFWPRLSLWGLGLGLFWASLVDLKYGHIPHGSVAMVAATGLVNLWSPVSEVFSPLDMDSLEPYGNPKGVVWFWSGLLGILVISLKRLFERGFQGFWIVSWSSVGQKRHGLGWGDVNLMIASGFWLAPQDLPVYLFCIGAGGILMGIGWKAFKNKKTFPFAPVLCVVLFSMVWWRILQWIIKI